MSTPSLYDNLRTIRAMVEKLEKSGLTVTAQMSCQVILSHLDDALITLKPTQLPENLPSNLTPREQQILKLLQFGMSNQRIASTLGVTSGTIKTYLKSIFTKLGVNNRTQAALLIHKSSSSAGSAYAS